MSSRGVNKVILLGRIGQDPKFGYLPNGSAAMNLSLATSEVWRDKNTSEKQERTEWHKVCIFGKLAEIMENRLHKGDLIYAEGKLRTRKWTDKAGVERYNTEVIADDIQFTRGAPAGAAGDYHPSDNRHTPESVGFDDDIPF